VTIGGLVYGPTLGAPAPSPWANVHVAMMGPTLIHEWFPYFVIQQARQAVERYQGSVITGVSAVGDGDIVPAAIPDTTFPTRPEVCWRNDSTGVIKCWSEGSIFEPGGTWGPEGAWFKVPAGGYYDVIDPDLLPAATVFEDAAPGGEEVAIDWGTVFSGAIDIAQGQFPGGLTQLAPPIQNLIGSPQPAAPPPAVVNGAAMPYTGSCPPRKTRTLTIDCATGQEVKRTRRRRRRLLTSSDLGDLAQLQALVGKGSNAMSVAVSKAIR